MVPVNVHARPGWFLARPLASPSTDAWPRMQKLTGYVPLQAELDNGESVKALRRFNRLLSNLPADSWGEGPSAEAHAEQGRVACLLIVTVPLGRDQRTWRMSCRTACMLHDHWHDTSLSCPVLRPCRLQPGR
jgi:hypothetical protein